MLALIFARRVKKVLNSLIDETNQVLDLVDHSYLISDDSFVFFLDFFKAFDTVKHHFLYHSLKKFGFGDFFCNAIKTLYNNANCSLNLKTCLIAQIWNQTWNLAAMPYISLPFFACSPTFMWSY